MKIDLSEDNLLDFARAQAHASQCDECTETHYRRLTRTLNEINRQIEKLQKAQEPSPRRIKP